jgi:O-antigen/teichoic acid export membrane protein
MENSKSTNLGQAAGSRATASVFANRLQSGKTYVAPKLRRVSEFLGSQGIAMAGNLFYGFLCVRLLPIPEYAKYVTVFGFQSVLSVLMDVSFSSTLLPLIGECIDDRKLIADYIASLRQLAHWLFVILAPAAMAIYPFIVRKQHWSWQVVAAMLAILLTSAWFARMSGAYSAVLIVRRDRKYWYRIQIISSLGMLTLLLVLWRVHVLNAFSAMLINLGGVIFVAWVYYARARQLTGMAGAPSGEKRRSIMHLAAPNLPSVIFYAFQGQISLFLIAYFGHASAIASVGALMRLGQVFVPFTQMTPMLIEPYFARLPVAQVKRNYLILLGVEGGICTLLAAFSRAFPGVFLWILGTKYQSLHYEVFLLIAGSSVSYLAGVLWAVHNARRFTYWWYGASNVIVQLSVQIYFVCRVDLSTVRAVLTMNLLTNFACLAVVLFTGVYGFIFGPRRILESE